MKGKEVAKNSVDRIQKENYSKTKKVTWLMITVMSLIAINGNNNNDKSNK